MSNIMLIYFGLTLLCVIGFAWCIREMCRPWEEDMARRWAILEAKQERRNTKN